MITLKNGYDKKTLNNYRPMTINEAKQLSYGDHVWFTATDGSARQCKINGKVRTWKRDANRIEVPCKFGLYEYCTFRQVGNGYVESLLVKLPEDDKLTKAVREVINNA